MLVGAEGLAPGTQHVVFQRRHAGAEAQHGEHRRRRQQRPPTHRIGARQVDGEGRIGEPAEPFEQVVGMAGPAPETNVADAAGVGGIVAEAGQLPVGRKVNDFIGRETGEARS